MSIRTDETLKEHSRQIEALQGELAALAEQVERLKKQDLREPIRPPRFPRNLRIRGFEPPGEREASPP